MTYVIEGDGGITVVCTCGERHPLPSGGGAAACPCGLGHRYDGSAVYSYPGAADEPAPTSEEEAP